jgi:hypothetical protein
MEIYVKYIIHYCNRMHIYNIMAAVLKNLFVKRKIFVSAGIQSPVVYSVASNYIPTVLSIS